MPEPIYYNDEGALLRRRDGAELPPDETLWPDGWRPYGAGSVSEDAVPGKKISRAGEAADELAFFTSMRPIGQRAAKALARSLGLPTKGW